MARTYRNLWPQVVSWNNLVVAYQKCRRRKRYRRQATEFDFAWEANLLRLQHDLASGEYEPGGYRHFYVHEPKRRKISAAPFRDRVVHHAVVNVLEPLYERRFLYDSYACRKGKGTHRAIQRAVYYLRRSTYFLKTDIIRLPRDAAMHKVEAIIARARRRSSFKLAGDGREELSEATYS